MAGTPGGGRKAAETNKKRYGKNFYRDIGKDGGKARNPNKGFGSNRERAIAAGAKGGRAKVPKGIALLTDEKKRQAYAKAAATRAARRMAQIEKKAWEYEEVTEEKHSVWDRIRGNG